MGPVCPEDGFGCDSWRCVGNPVARQVRHARLPRALEAPWAGKRAIVLCSRLGPMAMTTPANRLAAGSSTNAAAPRQRILSHDISFQHGGYADPCEPGAVPEPIVYAAPIVAQKAAPSRRIQLGLLLALVEQGLFYVGGVRNAISPSVSSFTGADKAPQRQENYRDHHLFLHVCRCWGISGTKSSLWRREPFGLPLISV